MKRALAIAVMIATMVVVGSAKPQSEFEGGDVMSVTTSAANCDHYGGQMAGAICVDVDF